MTTQTTAPLAPQQLSMLWRMWAAWKRVGRRIGDFQARLLLSLFYFTALAPFALAVRAATDPLSLKSRTPRGWLLRTAPVGDPLARARRQF